MTTTTDALAGTSTTALCALWLSDPKGRKVYLAYAENRAAVSQRKRWAHVAADFRANAVAKIKARAEGFPEAKPAKPAAKAPAKAAPKPPAKKAPAKAPASLDAAAAASLSWEALPLATRKAVIAALKG